MEEVRTGRRWRTRRVDSDSQTSGVISTEAVPQRRWPRQVAEGVAQRAACANRSSDVVVARMSNAASGRATASCAAEGGPAPAMAHTATLSAGSKQAKPLRHLRDDADRNGGAWFPMMSPEEVAPLTVDCSAPPATIRSKLVEHGVCLVTGVLTPEECKLLEQVWSNDLVSVLDDAPKTGEFDDIIAHLRRGDLTAWPAEWSTILGRKNMASQRGAPHGGFAWTARLNPTVRHIFASLFEVSEEDLCVGLDLPFWSAANSPSAKQNVEWLHVDQNHCTGMTWQCAQGVLYVWASDHDACSTTVVWPGSHSAVYDSMMADPSAIAKGSNPGGQSVKINELEDPDRRDSLLAAALAGSRRVPCPAGSLLLWDSRIVHQGWAGGPRLAQPVCWEPRSRRDPGALARKVFMCAAGVPSSHSSSEGRVHGMATRTEPTPTAPAPGEAPGARAQLVPHGVAPHMEVHWQELQSVIWRGGGDPRRNARSADIGRLRRLLRPEVLEAL